MPFALAADVGFIAIGVILFLLCVGGSYLIEGIAGRLPAIRFLGLSLDFAAVFRKITWPVVAFITTVGVLHFKQVENWLRGIAYTLIQNGYSGVQVARTHAGQIAHIVNGVVPAATAHAIQAANGYTTQTVQGVRDQVHAAEIKWEAAHTYTDAKAYIALEKAAPSVEHAILAMVGAAYIAGHDDLWTNRGSMKDYVDGQIAGVKGWVDAGVGARVTGVEGAITIPGPIDLSNTDVQDIIKTGSQIAVGTAVAVIATKIVECLVSKCAGNNNFQNLLNDALGLLAAAEFATFVEAFVKDPAGTLNSYTAPLTGLIEGGETDVSHVWTAVEGALGL